MYIVTGGLGFIGSNIVRELHKRGESVLIVDDRAKIHNRIQNISDCASAIQDVIDPEFFFAHRMNFLHVCDGIFHQGACADTTERDSALMMKQNVDHSKAIIKSAIDQQKKLVYASSAAVYGNSKYFAEERENERPLNSYGLSKLIVDNYAREAFKSMDHQQTMVGLRYFNVYGRGEDHKHKMKSMPRQLFDQSVKGGPLKIFKDGAQKRDFVHVSDVVNVNMHFMFSQKPTRGIFNVGTEEATSFQTIATLISQRHSPALPIEFIDIPEKIRPFYQSYTCADLTDLRAAGYDGKFLNIAEGMQRSWGI